MEAKEFTEWRKLLRVSQEHIAKRLGVTRNTVQNWESGATPVPQAVETACDVWGHRLQQEDPSRGPVTLIYSDGPMFVNPYGPRARLPMMQQEPYQTNAMALARVQQLWGRDDFHNPFILLENGKPLWNLPELARVLNGEDTGAPIFANAVNAVAEYVEANSSVSVTDGPQMLSPSDKEHLKQRLRGLAEELRTVAGSNHPDQSRRFENILDQLHEAGFFPPNGMVSDVAHVGHAVDFVRSNFS